MLEEIIPKKQLKAGKWYLGCGRGSSVALWNGHVFLFFDLKFGSWVEKNCDYADEKGGCFAPIEEIDTSSFPSVNAYYANKEKNGK